MASRRGIQATKPAHLERVIDSNDLEFRSESNGHLFRKEQSNQQDGA